MRIKKVILKDFKRFTNLEIDLDGYSPKIVALVGPNGSGKSSVFDAFEELNKNHKGSSYNPQVTYLSKSLYVTSSEPSGASYSRNSNINVEREDSAALNIKSFYIRTPYRYTPSLNITQIRAQEQDLLNDTNRPGSMTQIDSRLTENYERLQGKAWKDVFVTRTKTGQEIMNDLLGQINQSLRNILGDISVADLGNVIEKRGQLFFHKGSARNIPYEDLSSGEKEVLDIVLDLIIKKDAYNDTIFCIDEPELHINPSIQRNLLIEIEKLVPNNCQLWIATHSIGFLQALQKELKDKSIVLDFDKDFDVEQILTPMKTTPANWKKLFKITLEDLTGLLAPEQIYYCEGRNDTDDERGIDAICYNKIFEITKPEILFVSSGGNTEPDGYSEIALKVLAKAFDSLKIFVLKDRDNENRDEWLKVNPTKRRMLKRRELENYLYDWEVVSKLDNNASKEEYDKLVKDIINDELKDLSITFRNTVTPTLKSIDLKTYKQKLAEVITPEMKVYQELEKIILGQE